MIEPEESVRSIQNIGEAVTIDIAECNVMPASRGKNLLSEVAMAVIQKHRNSFLNRLFLFCHCDVGSSISVQVGDLQLVHGFVR